MKPHQALAVAFGALLWLRQLRFERRIARRQGRWEREATRGITGIFNCQVGEIEDILRNWSKALSGESRRSPGGARR